MAHPKKYQSEERNSSTKIMICGGIKQRYVIAFVCLIAASIEIIERNCIPLTLEYMVKPKNQSITERRSQCPRGPGNQVYDHYIGSYEWSDNTRSGITASFYIGYIGSHLPMGMVAEFYGFKWPFFGSVLASSIVTAIIPIVVEYFENWGLFAMNILLGVTQGGLIPMLTVVLVRWFPLRQRSRYGALLIGGNILGNILVRIFVQNVFKYKHWSLMFYISAGLGAGWSLLILGCCYSIPDHHPFISKDEKSYLNSNVLHVSKLGKRPPIPWKLMLSNSPVWAYIVIHIAHDWVLYSMLLDVPLYLLTVLRFSRQQVVLWSVIPLILFWIVTMLWGIFSDYLINRELMNLVDLRKMNTIISSFGPGLFLLFLSYAECQFVLAIMFFTLCMCMTGPFFSGAKLNAIDLCPNYAGTLMGISDGLGSLGAVAPDIISMLGDKDTLSKWRDSFWLSFIIIISAAIIFILFGSSQLQSWNMPSNTFEITPEAGLQTTPEINPERVED